MIDTLELLKTIDGLTVKGLIAVQNALNGTLSPVMAQELGEEYEAFQAKIQEYIREIETPVKSVQSPDIIKEEGQIIT